MRAATNDCYPEGDWTTSKLPLAIGSSRCIAAARGGALTDCFGSILLKKSTLVSMGKKYASEIEILNHRRGIRTKISRSCVLKRRFHRSVFWQFEKTDFFNRIGRLLPVIHIWYRVRMSSQRLQHSAHALQIRYIKRASDECFG